MTDADTWPLNMPQHAVLSIAHSSVWACTWCRTLDSEPVTITADRFDDLLIKLDDIAFAESVDSPANP